MIIRAQVPGSGIEKTPSPWATKFTRLDVGERAGTAPKPGLARICSRCGAERPVICLHCHGTRFKNLRLGVSRAAEELTALAGRPVTEVTAAGAQSEDELQCAGLLIGTEAVLHRAGRADAVAFLDFDQELLSTRYRAAEQAHGLGYFIRSLVGLDREAVSQAFGRFVSGTTAAPDQIEFIGLIVQELTQAGVMEAERLYQSPFIDINPLGPEGVFPSAVVDQLFKVIADIRLSAAA